MSYEDGFLYSLDAQNAMDDTADLSDECTLEETLETINTGEDDE